MQTEYRDGFSEEVYKIERESFIQYAQTYGFDPNLIAKRQLEYLKTSLKNRFNHTPVDADLEIDPVDSLLCANRRAVLQQSKNTVNKLIRFMDYEPILFNLHKLNVKKRREALQEIKGKLLKVPILLPYTNDPEAFTKRLPTVYHYVVISRSLSNLTELFLFPAVINLVNPAGKATLDSFKSPTAKNIKRTAWLIASLAQFYAGIKKKIQLDYELCKESEASHVFGKLIHWGAQDFFLLHEYSHVLLGHATNHRKILNEVEADVLAFNTMMYRKNITNQMPTIASIKSFGPQSLLIFLWIIEILEGTVNGTSHPLAITRFKYISLLTSLILPPEVKNRTVRILNDIIAMTIEAAKILNIHNKNEVPKLNSGFSHSFNPKETSSLSSAYFYAIKYKSSPDSNFIGFKVD